jgi:hypothetical protein
MACHASANEEEAKGDATVQNVGLCNKCKATVPCEFETRNGQKWILKDCPTCGRTESMVSSDAAAWQAKRDMWSYVPTEPEECGLRCDQCNRDHHPNMVFLDVTNRCNMNCPICIATIRGMGFDFNPPMAYFEKIFAALGKMPIPPVVQLFGGEPTVRNDLPDIIATARRYGLKPHVTTNGIRLADEEYCKMLCDMRVPMRFGFDGSDPEIYEKLRDNRGCAAKKLQGLANLKKHSRRRHTIISCAAKGINDKHMGDLIQFAHDNRDLISDLGIIPLTENWEEGAFDVNATTTMEDVEKMVQQAVPGGGVEFVPAGLSYSMKLPRLFFRKNPRSETLLLAGVHPNCESLTLLISDGKTFRGANHYLKKSFTQAAVEFASLSDKINPKLSRLDRDKFFQRLRGQLLIVRTFAGWVLRTVNVSALTDGHPVTGVVKAAWGAIFRGSSAKAGPGSKNRRPRRILRVAMLPFEEQHSVDGARMENCKAAFAYEDPDDGKVKFFGACLWYPYRNAILKRLADKYGQGGAKQLAPEDTPAGDS